MINIGDLKKEIQKSGKDNRTLIYIKDGEKRRVRFLTDLEEGCSVTFHDSYKLAINIPCQEVYGRDCQYCDDENLRTRNQYFWTVWDYDAKERKLLMAAVNNCSPVPSMSALYDEIGTLTDRDYVIKRVGSGQDTSYVLLPMTQEKFKNKRVKPFTEEEILEMLDRIYPDENSEKKEKGKRKTANGVKGKMNEPEEDGDDWGNEESAYEDMKPQELYKLCVERGISCKPKKPKEFYIDLLEEWDEENEDGDDWDELPFN